jgi:hypothetical protein
MLEESRCPPAERFLMVIGQYSAATTAKTLGAVRAYYGQERHRFDEAAAALTEEFLAWSGSFTGGVLQTCYCHADVARGRVYDVVFGMATAGRVERMRAVVQYNVIWGQVASAGLVHGWHQAAFFEFPDGVPELVASLPVDDFQARPLIGLCASEDWPGIAPELARQEA